MGSSEKTRRYNTTQSPDLIDQAKAKFEADFNEANLSLIIRILLKKYVNGKVPITIEEVVKNSRKYRATYENVLAMADGK